MSFWTNLSERDRRAVSILTLFLVLALAINYWPESDPAAAEAPASADNIDLAKKRLDRLRALRATIPARHDAWKTLSNQIAAREKGLIAAETAAQAQANLTQVIRRVGRSQQPPLEPRVMDVGQIREFGADYGEVFSSYSFECKIDQLVNFLADLTRQPEALATEELRVLSPGSKEKTISVRLVISGLVPRALVPDKKKGGRT
ncbi:MAG: hypothetical protein K2Q23_04490 [Bryobacteraceae bacterium]|nr:hypothetical protein [Bryobacteraceae bacterium]